MLLNLERLALTSRQQPVQVRGSFKMLVLKQSTTPATMAVWRTYLSPVSFVIVIFVTRVNCIRHLSSESLTFATHENEEIEYDENPRIEIRHGDRIINDTLTKNGRYGNIDVIVYAFKETFTLNVKLNRKLFASTYVEKILTKTGVIFNSIDHTENNCYYIGRVQDKENSAASVATCKGITGQFTIATVSYHIERGGNLFSESYKVYRIRRNSSLADGRERNEFTNWLRFNSRAKRLKRSFMWPQDKDKDKVLELYIANDHSQFLDKGRDASVVFQRAKNIANFASSLYHIIGVYFVLVGMEVWTDADKFPILDSDVDTTLSSWYRYRTRYINPFHYNDNAVLLTRVQFYSQVIGKAVIGEMCSNQFSGEVVVDKSNSPSQAGSTMAHEIGHSFGLIHDDGSCSCPDSVSKCIMYPSASSIPATNWSSCSIAQFGTSFREGLDICLYDVPQTIYEPTVSTCGNGIVENGEQCDCGKATKQECNSSCCSPTTCRLIGSASCSSGMCCDISRCQILAAGSLCRSNSSDCDLPEHCDGVASTCPVDTYKPDGTNCTINGDSVYCYGGKCRSHNTQCQLLWGRGTSSSNSLCYERFNNAGAHYGNCGYNWTPNITFIACQQKNVKCGKLLCDIKSVENLVYYQNYILVSTASIGSYTCNSVIFDFGLRVQDPGLVPNGASCGDGKMCVNQVCVDASSLAKPCPRSCRGGVQMCNNLGQCQGESNGVTSILSSTQRTTVIYQTNNSSSSFYPNVYSFNNDAATTKSVLIFNYTFHVICYFLTVLYIMA